MAPSHGHSSSQSSILSFFRPKDGGDQQHKEGLDQQDQQQGNDPATEAATAQPTPQQNQQASPVPPPSPGPAPVLTAASTFPAQDSSYTHSPEAEAAAEAAAEVAAEAAAEAAVEAAVATTAMPAYVPVETSAGVTVFVPMVSPTPHPQAYVVPITAEHVSAVRRVNNMLLQVSYPDSFYARVLDPYASGLFSRAIVWALDDGSNKPPRVIGSIVVRLDPCPFEPGAKPPRQALYIQSLTLLAPYRSLGIATAALEAVIKHAVSLTANKAVTGLNVTDMYAHVWTENHEGLRWYEARGFVRQGDKPENGYYLKLNPGTAWVVRRPLAVDGGDGLEEGDVE